MNPARKKIDTTTYSGRLAKRLRSLRDKNGYTVEEVAERMERFGHTIKPNTLRHWEIARISPPWDAVPALAKALKVKPRELIPAR